MRNGVGAAVNGKLRKESGADAVAGMVEEVRRRGGG